MDKQKVLKICGIGSVALYLGGASEGMVTGLVGGTFIIIGLIAAFFK